MCWSHDQWRRRIGLGGHGGCTTGTIRCGRSNTERSAEEDENNCRRAQDERNERENKEFVNEACRQAREEGQIKKFFLTCAVFCVMQIRCQGLEFPVESESTTNETTGSDEHVVDRVESVVETISTSNNDPVVEAESSSQEDARKEQQADIVYSRTSKNSPPKTSHLTVSRVNVSTTSIVTTLLVTAHTVAAAGSGDSSNVGSVLTAVGAVAVLAGQMYSSSKSSSKKRVFKDITNRVGVHAESDDSESDDGEVFETLVLHKRNNPVPSSNLPPINEDRGYALDKPKSSTNFSGDTPSVDEQKTVSFLRSKCTNDEMEEGEVQLDDSSVKPCLMSRGYILDKPKSSEQRFASSNFFGDTSSVDDQKPAASPMSKCNNDEMEEGEVRENIPSLVYDVAKSKYESFIGSGQTTDVAFVCTVNSLKKDKRVEIIPPNSPEAIVFDVVLANADLTGKLICCVIIILYLECFVNTLRKEAMVRVGDLTSVVAVACSSLLSFAISVSIITASSLLVVGGSSSVVCALLPLVSIAQVPSLCSFDASVSVGDSGGTLRLSSL